MDRPAINLQPDELPWLDIATQVLVGKFKKADRSTVESITIGLRGISHPDCEKALKLLEG